MSRSWPRATRSDRLRRPNDDGFAMITSILLIMIVGALSVAVAGVVLAQTKPTQAVRKDTGTLNAAQSGFEVALHRLRAATDASGNGVVSNLPCTMTDRTLGTLISGSVGPNAGAFQYRVYVRYYFTDPTPMTVAQRRDNTIACSANSPVATPGWAFLEARGSGTDVPGSSAGQGNRNLHTTYQFRTSNLNVAGGRLNANTTNLCMDAGTAPAVGSNVVVKTCLARGANSQSWAYRSDLTIYYAQSGSPGLCLSGGARPANTPLTLQTCVTAGTTYPYVSDGARQQEFSFDDNGKFEGANTNGDINGLCIATVAASPANGDQLQMRTCSTGGFDFMTWNPDTQVGAGPAGDNTQQLVNYQEFGRCLDVTDQNVNATWLIDYPCKQAPDPTKISWNQRWVYVSDGAGSMTVRSSTPSGNYCLQSPATTSPVAADNLVLAVPCAPGIRQRWTKTGAVAGSYAASYQITNGAGLCLSLAAGLGNAYHQQFSSIIVEPCDGGLDQKWNAPPALVDSRLKDTSEQAGG